jgi:deoxyribonuclease-4
MPNIHFCLDTAHAFAYGYNLEESEAFVELLDQTMGTQNIKLIHLNDSSQICGSKIDQHEIPGNGLIGKDTLLQLSRHKKLRHIPIIAEPPSGAENIAKTVMELREYL